MKGYFKYIKPYLLYFIVGPILMLTEVAGEVFLPKFMQMSIDNGIKAEPQSTGYVLAMGGLMILTAFIMMAGGVGGNFFAVKASANFAADLRKDVYGKVQEFSFKNIDTFSTGSLVTRLTNDITQLQNMLRMCLVASGAWNADRRNYYGVFLQCRACVDYYCDYSAAWDCCRSYD